MNASRLCRRRRAQLTALLWITAAGCASPPPPTTTPAQAPAPLAPFEGIRVAPAPGTVEVEAWTCLDAGWLEQIACSPGTREHEALVVVKAKPSEIHAALLMAGLEPGSPGSWHYDESTDELDFIAPRGETVEIRVRYQRHGVWREEPIGAWIEDANGESVFPNDPFIFAGSLFAENLEWMGPGEHYVADMTGSIVGLVTFGDEVVAFSQVLADQESVQPPLWQVRHDAVPPLGTKVTLILRRPDQAVP